MSTYRSRSWRRATLALVAFASLVLVAGCGGDGGSESSSTSTASSATQPVGQLVEQADAICTAANEQRGDPPPISGKTPNPADLRGSVNYFEDELRLTQDTYDKLVELAPPEGLEAQWDGVLAGFKDGVIANYPELIATARQGDPKAFLDAIEKIQTGTADLPQLASEVGLQVCATSG